MLMRGGPRRPVSIIFFLSLVAILTLTWSKSPGEGNTVPSRVRQWLSQGVINAESDGLFADSKAPSDQETDNPRIEYVANQPTTRPGYTIISSMTTTNGDYFRIRFGQQASMNPNIIPHPFLNDTWLMVAQLQRSKIPNSIWFAELQCNAQFLNGMLQCIHEPMILPLPSTKSAKCEGDLSWAGLNVGPHDGRVFYGPDDPFIMYGSNSQYNCFGLWMQNMLMLVDWGMPVWDQENFRYPTDLQRPGEHGAVEKNWFIFWDSDGKMYGHFDTTPRRVFSEMHKDGSVGEDLGAITEEHDKKCIAKYLPEIPPTLESIHQSTNSLSITLCRRADPDCKPTDDNTFIMTLVHHKTFYDWHGEYEPYIYLFQRTKPFKLHGIIKKPLWIQGRRTVHIEGENREHTQMFYVVSISWKNHGQKYHGYIDDPLFIAFGIEDDRPAAIDVLAGDVVQELGLCE